MNRQIIGTLAITLFAAACSDPGSVTGPDSGLDAVFSRDASSGHVYTATNGVAGNEIRAFRRSAGGQLVDAGAWSTGGTGTGTGLGNQGGIVMAPSGRWLFAVNAGDNSISVFSRLADGSLQLSDNVSSGGLTPISITQHEDMVYVLHAGGDGGITGFHFAGGSLAAIPNSDRPLSQVAPGPAQIEFVRNGSQLVVTEKGTNRILVYNMNRRTRLASQPVVNESAGVTPFGFAFDHAGRLIVSNAAGGAAGAGSLTSYIVRKNGSLEALDIEVPNFQGAPCWVAVSRDGRYAYTTNTASNTTSGYGLAPRGRLDLLDANGVTATNSGAPIDAAVSRTGGHYLYVLNGSASAIDAFSIANDGSLTPVGSTAGLPAGTNGLIAW